MQTMHRELESFKDAMAESSAEIEHRLDMLDARFTEVTDRMQGAEQQLGIDAYDIYNRRYPRQNVLAFGPPRANVTVMDPATRQPARADATDYPDANADVGDSRTRASDGEEPVNGGRRTRPCAELFNDTP